jgi:hypothetical protein
MQGGLKLRFGRPNAWDERCVLLSKTDIKAEMIVCY